MSIIKDIAALILSIILFSSVPIYDQPFGGCVKIDYFSFSTGCSIWPEFLRGFIFITAIIVFASHKNILIIFGLLSILLVVMSGGAEQIGKGEEMLYFLKNYLAILDHLKKPLLIGSFSAFLIYIGLKVVNRLQSKNQIKHYL